EAQVLGELDERVGARDDDFRKHAAGVAAARARELGGGRAAVDPALEEDAGDAVADGKTRDAGADGDDPARAGGERHAGSARAARARGAVAAREHHDVAAIQRDGTNAHGHLAGARRARFRRRELERVPAARAGRKTPLANRLA